MNNILKSTKKKNLVLSIIFKISTYICWFLFVFIIFIMVRDEFNKDKLIYLILFLFISYSFMLLFKYLYKRVHDKGYKEIKHSIEMYYFKECERLDVTLLDNQDKEYIANKIIEITFNIIKIISDLFEHIIPLIIGLVLFIGVLNYVNVFLALLISILLVLLLVFIYKKYNNDIEITNYNDLLKDFILKINDIRMLNVFSFCYKKLDKYDDNSVCIVNKNINYNIYYELGLLIILFISIITSIFLVDNLIDIIGITAFYLLIMFELKELINEVVPTIYNIKDYKHNKKVLETLFNNTTTNKFINNWTTIKYEDASYTYLDSKIKISIPSFEFVKGDSVSILGTTGEGKSTILHLLSGLYELSDGKVMIDNKITSSSIDNIYVSRSSKLFKISLRDNILLGNKINDNELIDLFKEIGIIDWYNKLPSGLDTIMDINYIDIPDDIREKINILRVTVTPKEILLLDDPTYDLDVESDKKVLNVIKKYWKKKSYIFITRKTIYTNICKKHYFIKNHKLLESETLL